MKLLVLILLLSLLANASQLEIELLTQKVELLKQKLALLESQAADEEQIDESQVETTAQYILNQEAIQSNRYERMLNDGTRHTGGFGERTLFKYEDA